VCVQEVGVFIMPCATYIMGKGTLFGGEVGGVITKWESEKNKRQIWESGDSQKKCYQKDETKKGQIRRRATMEGNGGRGNSCYLKSERRSKHTKVHKEGESEGSEKRGRCKKGSCCGIQRGFMAGSF